MRSRAAVQVFLLGPFRVRVDGEDIPPGRFGGRLVRVLLRMLLTRRGEMVTRDVLAEGLWQREAPAEPTANLKVLVSRARRALPDPSLIVTVTGGYMFSAEGRCEVDAEVFSARVDAGCAQLASGCPREALEAFLSALGEWGGEPLPEDAYAEWAQEYRRLLWRRHVDALEGAARAALAVEDVVKARMLAERAVAQEPLREQANLLLVETLARSGDTAGAVGAYETYRRTIADELGLDPSPIAAALQLRLLRGELAVAHGAHSASARTPPTGTIPSGTSLFVGRDAELRVVEAAARQHRVTLVAGHAGSGKSRLLAEVQRRASVPVLSAAACPAERDQPWGLAATLLGEAVATNAEAVNMLSQREAAALRHLLPELGDLRAAGPPPGDSGSLRALCLHAGVRLMAWTTRSGLLLIVDDAHWADATSLEWLGSLTARVPALGLALAYRPEEVEPDGPLAGFLAQSVASGATRVELGPLPDNAILELVDDPRLSRLLLRHTDRTPLAVEEVLRALEQEGFVRLSGTGRWHVGAGFDAAAGVRVAQSGQRRAILGRYAALTAQQQEVVRLLALLGREASVTLLASAGGLDRSRALGVLDKLRRARLVRLGDAGWGVAHDAIGETIVESLTPEEGAGAHAALASALVDAAADPAEIGRHLFGAGDPQSAAAYQRDAARIRLDACANEEALRLADDALRLDPPAPLRLEFFTIRAEARRRCGDLEGARADLRAALGLARERRLKSTLLARMAMLTSGAEDYASAAELATAAIAAAGTDTAARAEALTVAGIIDVNAGRVGDAERRLAEAEAIYEAVGDVEGTARVIDARGMIALLNAQFTTAEPLLDRAARLFLDIGNFVRAVSPRTAHGAVLGQSGQAERALASVDEALALSRDLGHREDETFALIVRSQIFFWLGRYVEALRDAEEALRVSTDLGHREWTCHALWVLGQLRREGGELALAEELLHQALALAEGMPVHVALASSHLARVLIAEGRPEAARPHVEAALAQAVPLTGFDARLAQAELAAALGDPNAPALARAALEQAEASGYRLHHARLLELADASGRPARSSEAGCRMSRRSRAPADTSR